MNKMLADIPTLLTVVAVVAVTNGAIAVWVIVLRRMLQGRPLVRFESRRPVPWNGLDVLAVLFGYVCLGGTIALSAQLLGWKLYASDDNRDEARQVRSSEKTDTEASTHDDGSVDSGDTDEGLDLDRAHPVVVLLSGDSSPGTLLLCLFTVVVMAPLAEEFFFRLLVQGYFEKVDLRFRRAWRYSGRLVGLAPVLLSSLLFAALHAREPEAPMPAEQLVHLFAIDSLTKVLLVSGAIVYLKALRGATWDDLGLRLDKFWEDLGLAVASFLAVIVPVLLLQEGLGRLLPDVVPDPVPLFFFALALGYLYFRTHRLIPAILLHFIFNATALGVFFAAT